MKKAGHRHRHTTRGEIRTDGATAVEIRKAIFSLADADDESREATAETAAAPSEPLGDRDKLEITLATADELVGAQDK